MPQKTGYTYKIYCAVGSAYCPKLTEIGSYGDLQRAYEKFLQLIRNDDAPGRYVLTQGKRKHLMSSARYVGTNTKYYFDEMPKLTAMGERKLSGKRPPRQPVYIDGPLDLPDTKLTRLGDRLLEKADVTGAAICYTLQRLHTLPEELQDELIAKHWAKKRKNILALVSHYRELTK